MPRVLTFAGHCLIALVLTVLAQPAVAEEAQVLLGPNVAHGGFGAVVMGITEVNGETAIMGGVRAAWLIDHRVAIGVGGYGLASRHVGDVPADSLEQHVEMGYGGLEIEYILRPHAVVHGSALLLIGAGGAGYRPDRSPDEAGPDPDTFLVVEPGLYTVVNVAPVLRATLGISHRFIWDVGHPRLDNSDLRGFTAAASFQLGKF